MDVMNVTDAFWTCSASVNYGMTAIAMEIRFETLMGNFFPGHGVPDPETKYRLWVTSHNQPGLLFSSVVTAQVEPMKTCGSHFPTLLKSLVDDSESGRSQIDLVNEGPKFASLMMRRLGDVASNSKKMMWFGCRLELADDLRVKEHLTTMVISLRRERDEERRKRLELEKEVETLKRLQACKREDHDRLQELIQSIASAENNTPTQMISNPATPGDDKVDADGDIDFDVPADDDLTAGASRPTSSESKPFDHRSAGGGRMRPSSEQILRGIATYMLCALCPEEGQTAVPDETTFLDHVVNEHFDDESKRCQGCKTQTEVKDIPAHIKLHMNKVYACKFCGKQGTKKNVLQAHIRTHTGEKPYQCALCNRRFADASTLRRHRTTHTGEMRAACPICGRIISRRDNVKAHLRNNHGIEWSAALQELDQAVANVPPMQDVEGEQSNASNDLDYEFKSEVGVFD